MISIVKAISFANLTNWGCSTDSIMKVTDAKSVDCLALRWSMKHYCYDIFYTKGYNFENDEQKNMFHYIAVANTYNCLMG